MKTIAIASIFIFLTVKCVLADTFGAGANTFNITFVPIGSPGYLADPTGVPNPVGSVAYAYNIAKFEASTDIVTKANASGSLGITVTGIVEGPNRPATGVSWNEAARFVNWLNTSTGSSPAYKFTKQPGQSGYSANDNIQLWTLGDPGYNANNPYRNSLARYFLPSVNEWYKAAFYDPSNGVYYDYATGSNTAPTAVASGTAAGTAVYLQDFLTGAAEVTLAGGLSPYGTMGQSGNVYEWEETEFDLVNDSSTAIRGERGGSWGSGTGTLTSTDRGGLNPDAEFSTVGFRVASMLIPEPGSILLGLAGMLMLAIRRYRV